MKTVSPDPRSISNYVKGISCNFLKPKRVDMLFDIHSSSALCQIFVRLFPSIFTMHKVHALTFTTQKYKRYNAHTPTPKHSHLPSSSTFTRNQWIFPPWTIRPWLTSTPWIGIAIIGQGTITICIVTKRRDAITDAFVSIPHSVGASVCGCIAYVG